MSNIDEKNVFLVSYETDEATVHEYVSTIEYQNLLTLANNGSIRIMNERLIRA